MSKVKIFVLLQFLSFSALPVLAVFFASAVQAQCLSYDTFYTFSGEAAGDQFGFSVSDAGDVNNDGFPDFIIGAPFHDSAGADRGRAYVYSGLTGSLLYTFDGAGAGDNFGYSVSGAGDVDTNGYDDVIIGAPLNDFAGTNAGQAYVYSGSNGALLYTFTADSAGDDFGRSVSGAGDVNNDGFADVIVGAPLYDDPINTLATGRAYVYSGANGSLLYTFIGQCYNISCDDSLDMGFGQSVSGAGDVNMTTMMILSWGRQASKTSFFVVIWREGRMSTPGWMAQFSTHSHSEVSVILTPPASVGPSPARVLSIMIVLPM